MNTETVKLIVDLALVIAYIWLAWKCKGYLLEMKEESKLLKATNDVLTYHIMSQSLKHALDQENYELAARITKVIDALENTGEFKITVEPIKK